MEYKICIDFETQDTEFEYFKGKSHFSINGTDEIEITTNKILLTAVRKGNKSLGGLITNNKSTINRQITKALCYKYALTGRNFFVKRIIINKHEKNILIAQLEYRDIAQPFKNDLPLHISFSKENLSSLFDGFEKSEMLIVALAFFLKGLNEELHGDKFTKYWKAFNSLYSYISGLEKENEKLYEMRKFIEKNKHVFTNTLKFIDNHQKVDIRKLRLREMILNNFDTEGKTKSLKDLILRFNDYRINQVLKDMLPYREEYLRNSGYLNTVNNHLDSKIVAGNKFNDELLCFYLLKYGYFIRNKYFHAEKLDPTIYLIKNDEIKELKFINEIFEQFLCELISANALY